MAKNLIFCSVLWIVVAVIAEHTAVAENNTTTLNATTTTLTPPTTPNTTTLNTTTTTLTPATTPNTTTSNATTTLTPATTPNTTTLNTTTTLTPATTPNTTTLNTTTTLTPATTPNTTTLNATTTTTTTLNTTTTVNPVMTTAPDNTSAPNTTTASSTTAAPTAAPDPCDNNPCDPGSTCEARANQTFICLCMPGDYYNNATNRCVRAKVFPGLLQLPNITYEDSMSIKTSPAFKRTADTITEELSITLRRDPTYRGCIVLQLLPVDNTRLRVNQHVNASVELIYSAESTVTTSEVQQMVENATKCIDCPLRGATFREVELCEPNACDGATANCSSKDGTLTCPCLDGYIPNTLSNRICVACPSGQKAENSECVKCSFGHSGFNCDEKWLLILVIVGSVLGGLLLIALILLIIVSVRSPKKSSKRQTPDIGSPYMSHSPAKGPLGNGSSFHGQAASVNGSADSLAAFANAGVPRFPRATANNNYDNRTNLEMIHGNSRQNLVPMNSQLDDNQYDTNPYAQSRGQNNPYARSQGRTNPYYS